MTYKTWFMLKGSWIVIQMIRNGPWLPVATDHKDVFVFLTELIYQTRHILITMVQENVWADLESWIIHGFTVIRMLVVSNCSKLVFKFNEMIRIDNVVLLQLHRNLRQIHLTHLLWAIFKPNACGCKSFFTQSNALSDVRTQIVFEQLQMLVMISLLA
jgi:hypothetical protein